jgi:hypothetical protein
MNNNNLLQVVKWLIVISVLITLVLKATMFRALISWHSDMVSSGMAAAFILGALGSIIGLILKRGWGFMSFYALFLVATYLGISLIPVARLFPLSSRTILIIIINTSMFAATIWLQVKQNKLKHGK